MEETELLSRFRMASPDHSLFTPAAFSGFWLGDRAGNGKMYSKHFRSAVFFGTTAAKLFLRHAPQLRSQIASYMP